MDTSPAVRTTAWVCGACGEPNSSETALRDHREWCLGDGAANRQLLGEVAAREGRCTMTTSSAPPAPCADRGSGCRATERHPWSSAPGRPA